MGGTNQGIWKQKILIRFPSLHNITPGCIAIIWLICNMSFSFPLLYSIHSYIGQGNFDFYRVSYQFYSSSWSLAQTHFLAILALLKKPIFSGERGGPFAIVNWSVKLTNANVHVWVVWINCCWLLEKNGLIRRLWFVNLHGVLFSLVCCAPITSQQGPHCWSFNHKTTFLTSFLLIGGKSSVSNLWHAIFQKKV